MSAFFVRLLLQHAN